MGKATAKRPATWLAVLALLIQALLPIYGMAAALNVGAERVPVCSGTGIVWLPVDEGRTAPPSGPAAVKVCPFCAVHCTAFVSPAAATVEVGTVAALRERTVPVADAPRRTVLPRNGLSRAPPRAV